MMKNLFVIIIPLFFSSCFSQNNCTCQNCDIDYYVPNEDSEAYLYKAKDTLAKQLIIHISPYKVINDLSLESEIEIMVDGKRLDSKNIKFADAGHRIDVELIYENDNSCVKIVINKMSYNLEFKVKRGYRYVQIFSDKPEVRYKLIFSNYPLI